MFNVKHSTLGVVSACDICVVAARIFTASSFEYCPWRNEVLLSRLIDTQPLKMNSFTIRDILDMRESKEGLSLDHRDGKKQAGGNWPRNCNVERQCKDTQRTEGLSYSCKHLVLFSFFLYLAIGILASHQRRLKALVTADNTLVLSVLDDVQTHISAM